MELSLGFNQKNFELLPKTIAFIQQVYGVNTLTCGETDLRVHGAPTKKIMIEGEEFDFVYEEMSFSYKLVGCTDDTVTVIEDNPYRKSTEIKHFVDGNTYWVKAMEGSELREYFVRIEKGI